TTPELCAESCAVARCADARRRSGAHRDAIAMTDPRVQREGRGTRRREVDDDKRAAFHPVPRLVVRDRTARARGSLPRERVSRCRPAGSAPGCRSPASSERERIGRESERRSRGAGCDPGCGPLRREPGAARMKAGRGRGDRGIGAERGHSRTVTIPSLDRNSHSGGAKAVKIPKTPEAGRRDEGSVGRFDGVL
ncbi:MAG: hypothetical protein JWM72_1100, partial [Actinomycetia bacterium]|nr:hypothetical protein [Actinomycetes bacterium]